MHVNLTRTLMALGFVGATAVGIAAMPAPSAAQGVYFNAPGVSVGIGERPWYGHRRYHRHYGYYDDRPHWRYRDRGYRYRYYDDRW